MKTLYVIRHGETTGDVENRYGGAYDDKLSPAGEKQIQQLQEELKDSGIQHIFSSSLVRAQQTAEGLSQAVDCPVDVVDDLKERNQYGNLSGMEKEEAKTNFPELVEALKDRNNTLPNAESYQEASQRNARAFQEVVSQGCSCSAIVWHGGGMRVLFRDILEFGELSDIGDCSWVKLVQDDKGSFSVADKKRIVFNF